MKQFVLSAALVAVAVVVGFYVIPRVDIPAHLIGHDALYIPEIMTPEVGRGLYGLMKEMKHFPVLTGDLKFYNVTHEHVGEAQPIEKDGSCKHPYLIPSPAKDKCVLPGRIDVGRHYLKHGGVVGLKKTYKNLISRVQGFMVYMFDPTEYPLVSGLFSSPKFQKSAKDVCPPDAQVLDPFQFNFIAQLPGQTVALHLDAPYYWGATRFQFPQWLLVAMTFSGLFQEHFVNQVQVVGYLHEWTNDRDGSFVYWNSDDMKAKFIPPLPFAGTAVDGSKTVHAAMVYQGNVDPPIIDKDAESALTYMGEELWQLTSNGAFVRNYTTDDLRVTVVYRARCFKTEEDRAKYNHKNEDGTIVPGGPEHMKLEDILARFQEDLVTRGHLKKDATVDRLDLSLKILDVYTNYPLPLVDHAIIPYNYCMLGKLYPQLEALLSPLCK